MYVGVSNIEAVIKTMGKKMNFKGMSQKSRVLRTELGM